MKKRRTLLGGAILLLSVVLLLSVSGADTLAEEVWYLYRGNKAYSEGAFGDAEVFYKKAFKLNLDKPEAYYNLGNALYQQERYEEAIELYREALKSKNTEITAGAWANLGNACFMTGDTLWSIAAFRNALLLEREDTTIRQNFLFVLDKITTRRAEKFTEKKNSPSTHPKEDKPGPESRGEGDEKGNAGQDNTAQEFKLSDKNIEDMFNLIIQNEEAVRGKISGSKQKAKKTASDEKDY